MSCRVVCILLILATPARGAVVTDLGTVGAAYPVVEQDIRQEMRQTAERNWKERIKTFREKIAAFQPANLHHLPKARENHSFLVDMSYTLDRDLKDQKGKVGVPQGLCLQSSGLYAVVHCSCCY